MYKICVFAGTTEGRELVEFLVSRSVAVTACVATEYGETLLPESEDLTVLAGRLSGEEIRKLLEDGRFDMVVDATHPYAVAVTEILSGACRDTGTEYLRLLRSESGFYPDAVYVSGAEEAAGYLKDRSGNILLTTGSKELSKFSGLPDFAERVYARVLPLQASLEACASAGLGASHIIAMQGPFSEEMDLAAIRYASASWLVTKDGGAAGGFDAKMSAAKKAGAAAVVIGRPPQRDGCSFEDTVNILTGRFGLSAEPEVSIVGIGPGSRSAMTNEALAAIARADCLIGAKRMIEAVRTPEHRVCEAIAPGDIAEFIMKHPECRRFAVVMSGDTGFYSGTKKLIPLLGNCRVEVIPGLSSLSYLCSKLGTSYEDVYPVSLHGRDHDIVPDVRSHSRVFALVGGEDGIGRMCRALVGAGLGNVRISVGERLSYPDEKITSGTAAELAEGRYPSLSAALIENGSPDEIVTPGFPDTAFIRGSGENGVVPMTKSEVRAVCLSKLELTERSVCWDIGAGTGSVSVEMALRAKKGEVYAVERRADAAGLIRENAARFSVGNLKIIEGPAPDACAGLPAPTHAFIGGSSGNMREIIRLLLEKDPHVRIVATAVSLESAAELNECSKEFPFTDTETVLVQVARGRKAGDYNLMTGQNPVYIFTMQNRGTEE